LEKAKTLGVADLRGEAAKYPEDSEGSETERSSSNNTAKGKRTSKKMKTTV